MMNTESDSRWIYPLLVIYTLSVAIPSYATSNGEVSTSVRLVGGARRSEGRLEVLYNGTWGTVCDDFFASPEGSVVCRQLNYIGVLSTPDSSLFGAGQGPIWLDDVDCLGSENSILDCYHRGFGVNNCNHGEDVGIICDLHSNAEDGAVRLAGGDDIFSGRVEIFHDGEWGTVCETQWDLHDATVVCRQLGFQCALRIHLRSHYGAGVGTIWLSNISCTGSESRLDECTHGGWGVAPSCFHLTTDASVECEGDISTPPPNTPPQIESSLYTTTYEPEIIPSSTTPNSHTVLPSEQASSTVSLPSPYFTGTSSQYTLPMHSNAPTFPASGSDVGGDLSQMELILGLVALGVLLLVSTVLLLIVITVCVCRSMRTKSVQVEGFQQAGFPPVAGLGLAEECEDSEVVLTNANTQMSHVYSHRYVAS